MVLTEASTRMSRSDEVHRITENVYKVRRTWFGSLLPSRRARVLPRRDTCCAGGRLIKGRTAGVTLTLTDLTGVSVWETRAAVPLCCEVVFNDRETDCSQKEKARKRLFLFFLEKLLDNFSYPDAW